MFEAYMKQLIVDGNGKFTVIRIAAETQEGLDLKRGIYQGDDWQEATEAEYRAQFAERTAHVDGEADIALGEKKEEVAPEKAPEAVADAGTEASAETGAEAGTEKSGDNQEGVEAES